ncbi:MAG: hypothetical protein HOH74_02230, partial [Gemmatimonadetes bacterium]|nr:hypothetical protein [Gemmatimonadota bacterium]
APWSLRLRTLARDLPLLFGLNLLRILALSLYDGPASRLDRRRPRPDRPGGDGHRRPSAVDATRGSRATASTRGVGRGSTQLIMRWVAAFIGASLFIATMQSAWIEYLLGRLAVAFAQLAFGSDHPFYVWIDGADLAWRSGSAAQGSIGLRLLSYHLGLYLTAAIAVKHVRARQRLEWCAAALPVLLLWQIGDVLLGIESQWLTLARPSGYDVDVAGGLDLWFLLVKVANNFNVLAARQLVPLAILWAQWSRWQAQEQVRQGHPEDPPA